MTFFKTYFKYFEVVYNNDSCISMIKSYNMKIFKRFKTTFAGKGSLVSLIDLTSQVSIDINS